MKYFCIPFFLIAFASGLFAQERPLNFSFNVLLWAPFETLAPGQAEPTPPDLHYFSEGESIQVKGTWNVPTQELRFSGLSPLVFGVPAGIVNGEQRYNRVASVPMSEGDRHYIFIFFQSEDGSYRVFPIDAGLRDMPAGNLKLINYGGDAIFAKVGENVQELAHGGEWMIPVKEAKNFQLRVQLASQQDEGFRLLYRSSFAVSDESVRMVFLIHRSNLTSGSWRVRQIAGFDTINRSTEPVDVNAMMNDFTEDD